MELGDIYSASVPCLMTGQSASEKGVAGGATNIAGLGIGGMLVRYPVRVDYHYDQGQGIGWYQLRFEVFAKAEDNYRERRGDEAVTTIDRDAGGLRVEPGGPGCIFPFVDRDDRQLKFYVLHFMGDGQPRRWRILRCGIYY